MCRSEVEHPRAHPIEVQARIQGDEQAKWAKWVQLPGDTASLQDRRAASVSGRLRCGHSTFLALTHRPHLWVRGLGCFLSGQVRKAPVLLLLAGPNNRAPEPPHRTSRQSEFPAHTQLQSS